MAKNDKGKAAPMPLGKAIRQAGEGTITKPELTEILDSKSGGQFTQKLDQINKNLKENDKAGIGLGAAASNMLIRQASKQSPTGYDAYLSMVSGKPTLGTGRLGTELQRRATEFGTNSTNRNMSALVSGGQYMMPGGRTANLGFGKQYTYNGGGLGTGPYNSTNMPMNTGINDVGPLAPGTAKTTTTTEEEIPTTKEELPLTPEGMAAASTGSMSDPFSLTGAFNWRRNKGRGKGRGNKSTIAASRSRTMPTSSQLSV